MEKRIHICPICGRFVSKKQISKYKMLQEANQALKDEKASLLADLVKEGIMLREKEETVATLRKTVSDQTKHITYLTSELSDIKETLCLREKEIEKIYARDWWDRLLNMIPE